MILPLDAGCWAYDSMDANRTTTSSESCITQMDYDNTSATENTSPKTSHFNKIPWAHNYLSNPITPNNVPANGSTPQKIQTTADISSTPNIQSRIRPVSFSLPKRSCFLLHQSAAVFIQGLSGKQEEGVTVQERVKDLQEKVSHRTLRSPVSADVENQNLNQNPELNGLDDKPDVSTNGDQVSLCNRCEIPVEEPVVSGNEAQVLLRNDNGTGARVGSENIDSTEDQVLPASNQPQTSIPGVLNDTLNPKESSFPPPNRPKEPFCRVLSRDCTRVFLWPSEMLSFTKTSPSISFSINPLLYDFRAHNRARDGGEGRKKRGSEEGREGIKPTVIKKHEREVVAGGREVKIDERGEEDEGGQAGNPQEVVAHCREAGSRDESALKCVSAALGLQKTGFRTRKRKRRGGVRKRGRRKRGEETERRRKRRRRLLSSSSEILEGRGEERLKREEKVPLNNLSLGGRVREDGRMRGRNDEKRGRLLSNLPVNRCNRCDQLQVKSIEHQSQQSASRKPLYRREACNPAISPVPGSEIETSRCPTMGEMHEITGEQAGQQRNLIRGERNPAIRGISVQEATGMCLVEPPGATACNPAISLFPGSEKETPRCPEMREMHEITGEQAGQRRNLIRGEFNPKSNMASKTNNTADRSSAEQCDPAWKDNFRGREEEEDDGEEEEEETKRKKRKRGRRQARRKACFLRQERRESIGSNTDLHEGPGKLDIDNFLCPETEDTFSCDTADKFNDCEDEEMRKRCIDGPFRDFNFH
ncbi:hypothetical protein F7725_023596, partial [Dissostichus mawsoni]